MQQYLNQVERKFSTYLAELRALCRLHSLASDRQGINDTASAVASRMVQAGIDARIESVQGGAPVVIGDVGTGPFCLLVYNHYDVQPVEPKSAWRHDPFGAVLEDGRLFSRGVADNKGPLLARIQAIEAWRDTFGPTPLRVKFLVEGEEEVGSPRLAEFVQQHREELTADLVLWEGGGRDESGRPLITLGQKGLASFNLRVQTATTDQHSMWGAVIPNAAWRLVWALSSMKRPNGEITVDGMNELVRKPTQAENRLLDAIGFDESRIFSEFGVAEAYANAGGKRSLEKHLFGLACNINGLTAGYSGPGGKTVLPAEASAKLDIRLVPDLTPEIAHQLLRAHLERHGFGDVQVEPVNKHYAFRSSPESKALVVMVDACAETYGERPVVHPTSAGSGPMFEVCTPIGAPGASAGGVRHAGSNTHGPNENAFVHDYLLAIHFIGYLMRRLADASGKMPSQSRQG